MACLYGPFLRNSMIFWSFLPPVETGGYHIGQTYNFTTLQLYHSSDCLLLANLNVEQVLTAGLLA